MALHSDGEKLLVCDEEVVKSWSVTLVKDKDEILYCLIWKFMFGNLSIKKPFANATRNSWDLSDCQIVLAIILLMKCTGSLTEK